MAAHIALDALVERATALGDVDSTLRATVSDPSEREALMREISALSASPPGQAIADERILARAGEVIRAMEPDARREARRAGAIAVLATAAVLAAAALWPTTPDVRATASAALRNTPEFGAASAIDGRRDTSWLLPDGEIGQLVLQVPSRRVNEVRLLNTSNAPWNDRATASLRVVGSMEGREVFVSDVIALAMSPDPSWVVVPVGADVDSLRIEVLAVHSHGGGLAEVELH
jgi:hypothetical protein